MNMPKDAKPLLFLGEGRRSPRSPSKSPSFSKLQRPSPEKQGERWGPVFRDLAEAMENERIQLSVDPATAMDPEHVLVFELAGTVQDFRKAIERIEGLEFLAEYLGDQVTPDDDFFFIEKDGTRGTAKIQETVYAVMSNAHAAGELVSLFERWQSDLNKPFDHGWTKWRDAFLQLRALRRWNVQDRINETGLLKEWRNSVDLVGQSLSPIQVEIELWYRSTDADRISAQSTAEALVHYHGGTVISTCELPEIKYHAILAELPRQVAEQAIRDGADTIKLLAADQVMFASPHLPMTIIASASEDIPDLEIKNTALPSGLPRVALLDGLPMGNHTRLAERLIIDDPDDLESTYPVAQRKHGTAMASLIIHGDLRTGGEPLSQPLYVRPILEPQEVTGAEEVQRGTLITDLLHRAIRRIVDDEKTQSIKIINLSIGHPARGTIRWMSSLGRLVDWLAFKYNLLFIISAGNYEPRIEIPLTATVNEETLKQATFKCYVESSRQRGILPPGDAFNALTVGACHQDAFADRAASALVLDANEDGFPAFYSATGPGARRSVKPDLLYTGGKQVFVSPLSQQEQASTFLTVAHSDARGPGLQVAVPGSQGDRIGYMVGTSCATALVTREASLLFDILDALPDSPSHIRPDHDFYPVLIRALLIHAASWGDDIPKKVARRLAAVNQPNSRAAIGQLLGYGIFDAERAKASSANRAVMLGWGRLGQDEQTTFDIPLPSSLHAKAEWHRITITLAAQVKTVGGRMKYRAVRVFFDMPEKTLTGGEPVEVDSTLAKNGSVQHFVIEGRRALTITSGTTLPIHIECRKDAEDLGNDESIAYGLAVSIETRAEVSTTIFEEIEEALVVQAQAQARLQVRTINA